MGKHTTYGLTRTDKIINTGLEFLKELIEKTDNSVMQANLCTIEAYFEDVRDMHHSQLNMIVEALKEAQAHLEYCGYGDSWERECAYHDKLPEKIQTALAQVEKG